MTQPSTGPQGDAAPVLDGTDISADPADLDSADDVPATSDPEQMTGDDDLGGVAGQGGAG